MHCGERKTTTLHIKLSAENSALILVKSAEEYLLQFYSERYKIVLFVDQLNEL